MLCALQTSLIEVQFAHFGRTPLGSNLCGGKKIEEQLLWKVVDFVSLGASIASAPEDKEG